MKHDKKMLLMSLFSRGKAAAVNLYNAFTDRNFQIGLRLFGICAFMLMSNWLAALVCLFFPIAEGMSLGLGITAEEEAAKKALLDDISKKNKEQLDAFKNDITSLVNGVKSGAIDQATFNAEMGKVTEKLKEFDPVKYKAFQETIEKYEKRMADQEEAMRKQGETIKKLTEGGLDNPDAKKSLSVALKEILASDSFKEFVESGGKKKAHFELKAVSITSDYTGPSRVHITTRDSRVVDHPKVTRLNIRDLLTVSPADLPYLAFIEVYDWVRGVKMHTENESLAQSSFKVREATTDVKRIGTSLPISKRMLRSAAFIESHLSALLPAQVRFFEDFQLLFGDGAGNNVTGIFKVAQNFTTIINAAVAGVAGEVDSIESYNGGAGVILNFSGNKDINNGDIITIANATAPGYNASFPVIVIGPRQVLIETAYVAEANTDAWTFTINSRFKNAINAAQEIDVLKVAKTLVTRQEYSCTGFVMHPDDATIIETLKGNDEHYIDVKRLESGIMTIAGVPVVETTAMPSGKFACGDWTLAAALLEFTALVLEFSESTNEKLTNTVMAIVHEEILFPIYNKFMFVVGDFTSAKAAILKP
jgi:HK97 family phage major capsid protein